MPRGTFKKRTAKTDAYRAGLLAEMLAALLFVVRGYAIAGWRYKTPVGEIDLVARRGRQLVFVEVKFRKRLDDAAGSVNGRMASRISRAAQYFLAAHPAWADYPMRFDLVAVAPPFFWRHLDNAWRPPA